MGFVFLKKSVQPHSCCENYHVEKLCNPKKVPVAFKPIAVTNYRVDYLRNELPELFGLEVIFSAG